MNQARRAPNQACNCKDESGNPKELLATLQEAEEKVGRLNSELERSNEEKLRRIGKRLVLPPPFEHYKCPEGKGFHVAGFEGCVSRETLTQAFHQTFERELAKAEAEKPESAREGSEPKTQAEEAT